MLHKVAAMPVAIDASVSPRCWPRRARLPAYLPLRFRRQPAAGAELCQDAAAALAEVGGLVRRHEVRPGSLGEPTRSSSLLCRYGRGDSTAAGAEVRLLGDGRTANPPARAGGGSAADFGDRRQEEALRSTDVLLHRRPRAPEGRADVPCRR